MSTRTHVARPTSARRLGSGALAGVLGAVAFGLVLAAGSDAIRLVGALYGRPTPLFGWVAHLAHGAVFGVVFAAVLGILDRYDLAIDAGVVAYGLVYGALLGLVTGGVVLPVALAAAGARELPVPLLPFAGVAGAFSVAVSLAVGHLVYGLVLGAAYGRLVSRGRRG